LEEAEKLLADFDWSTVDARSDAEIVEGRAPGHGRVAAR
jgi:hypothetical protein